MDKKIIGAWGENIAKKYLENKGYQILEKNWRHGHKELDLIAFKKVLIGFEVKFRNNSDVPSFSILKASQVSNLRQTLLAYCLQNHFSYQEASLDLIVISPINKSTVKLNHYRHI